MCSQCGRMGNRVVTNPTPTAHLVVYLLSCSFHVCIAPSFLPHSRPPELIQLSRPPELIHLSLFLLLPFPPSSSFLPRSSGYDCPETVALQVYCEGRVLAQTEFTYYANTQYHSDQLFQYLVQNMPQYFQMDDIAGKQEF